LFVAATADDWENIFGHVRPLGRREGREGHSKGWRSWLRWFPSWPPISARNQAHRAVCRPHFKERDDAHRELGRGVADKAEGPNKKNAGW
jgi:hypothetical protein